MKSVAMRRLREGRRVGLSGFGVRIFVVLALLLGFAGPSFAQSRRGRAWWNESWKCRRTVEVQWPTRKRPGEESTVVSFPTGGYLQPKGEDIRVVAGGKNIPHKLVFVGLGDRVSLMFPCDPGQREYYVYYGNPDCAELEVDWVPQRGLIMETRPYRGGNCRNWSEMQAALARAGEPYGRALVENIFHGHNPFGPSVNFVTHYTGWLNLPVVAGARDVALSSASASFVFVDDKLFLAWPNWHRAVGDGRFHKLLDARASLYKVDYYHIQGNSDPVMVLAWKSPGEPRYEAVPGMAFMPPLPSLTKDYHVRGQTFAPDFEWWNRVEMECGERLFVEVGFTDKSYPKPDASKRSLWDFGDGITSTKRNPTHVYLATGTYTVTLAYTSKGRQVTCRQNVVVDRDWSEQLDPRTNTPEQIGIKTRGYSFGNLSGASLFGMMLLQRELGRKKTMLDVGEILLQKVSGVPAKDAAEAGAILSSAYLESPVNIPKAIEVLRSCEAGIAPQVQRARMARLLGDIYYHEMHQPAVARPEYERVVREYPDAKWHVRLAYMRLGDIERQFGKLAAAQRFYRDALENGTKISAARESLNIAMRALETEDYLRRGELDAAAASLDLWEWQKPEDKLRGQWSMLKVRHAMAMKNVAEAMQEAEILLFVNPESQYAPEVLLLLVRLRLQNREEDLARAGLGRLEAEYPDSPLLSSEEVKALRRIMPAEKPR